MLGRAISALVASPPPVKMVLPSGDQATQWTMAEWPRKVATSARIAMIAMTTSSSICVKAEFRFIAFRFALRRQEHIGQDRDNRDHDQELDQRKASHSVADGLMVVFKRYMAEGQAAGNNWL
jgi:hypothetical protein